MTNDTDKAIGAIEEGINNLKQGLADLNSTLKELPCHNHDLRLAEVERKIKPICDERKRIKNATIDTIVRWIINILFFFIVSTCAYFFWDKR